jgi:hypothetical protein
LAGGVAEEIIVQVGLAISGDRLELAQHKAIVEVGQYRATML